MKRSAELRSKARELDACLEVQTGVLSSCICLHMYTHIYTHIYIYAHTCISEFGYLHYECAVTEALMKHSVELQSVNLKQQADVSVTCLLLYIHCHASANIPLQMCTCRYVSACWCLQLRVCFQTLSKQNQDVASLDQRTTFAYITACAQLHKISSMHAWLCVQLPPCTCCTHGFSADVMQVLWHWLCLVSPLHLSWPSLRLVFACLHKLPLLGVITV